MNPEAVFFSRVRPFNEWAVSDLDRSMHRSLWAQVTQSSFIEQSCTTNNTASDWFNSNSSNTFKYWTNWRAIHVCLILCFETYLSSLNTFSTESSLLKENTKKQLFKLLVVDHSAVYFVLCLWVRKMGKSGLGQCYKNFMYVIYEYL